MTHRKAGSLRSIELPAFIDDAQRSRLAACAPLKYDGLEVLLRQPAGSLRAIEA